MNQNYSENVLKFELFGIERDEMNSRLRNKMIAGLGIGLLFLIVGLALVAAPRNSTCLSACKAQYDQDIQACIYYVNPTLTWGQCKTIAADRYRTCTSYCQ
jgi:hypothetical protein